MFLIQLLTTIFVCCLSVSDIRTRTIPGWAAPVFGLAIGILHLVLTNITALQLGAGLLPGMILLVLSLVFHASVGIGDAFAVMACGLALGLEKEFAALSAALILCAVFCCALLILKRVKRSDCLPFLPFLASVHLIMLTAEVIL